MGLKQAPGNEELGDPKHNLQESESSLLPVNTIVQWKWYIPSAFEVFRNTDAERAPPIPCAMD